MIVTETTDAIARICIARPQKANALTAQMLNDLASVIDRLTARGDVRALVLTGAGNVFSAGADLDAAKAGLAMSPDWERVSAGIAAMRCLTIAALNGPVAGGAMGMVLACDMRICVPQTQFFYPVMRLGYLPQPSDPARLAALIGPSRARMILLAGQKIPAEEALAWGLTDRIVPPEALMTQALELCTDALAATADHAAAIKRMI